MSHGRAWEHGLHCGNGAVTHERSMRAQVGLLLLACACALVGCHTATTQALGDREIVSEFCRNAEPVESGDLVGVSFPAMDDRTLMAAVRLARDADSQLYGDLAAVILRVHRAESTKYLTTFGLPIQQDVPRLFAARFAYVWRFPGDEPLLAEVAKWIRETTPETVDSELLRAEVHQGSTGSETTQGSGYNDNLNQ